MNKIISNELLSKVLREERLVLDYELSICGKEIHYGHIYLEGDGFISIQDLAYLCKEWALSYSLVGDNNVCLTAKLDHGINPIRLLSGPSIDTGFECSIDNLTRGAYRSSQIFYAETEPEAIFKAAQWVLDNKETK